MKKNFVTLVVFILLIIPLIYLALIYNSLPVKVPIHYSLEGTPDNFKDKSSLITLVLLLGGLSILMYFLIINIHKIDPKKSAKLSKDTMQKVALAIVVLMTAIMVMIIYSAEKGRLSFGKAMIPLMGLFFAYLGNLMHSVKPNYFMGIRTPWALEDEETWRKTHQLAGKLWFVGGLIIAAAGLILNHKYALYSVFVTIIIITLIPGVYSYMYYQKHKPVTNGK